MNWEVTAGLEPATFLLDTQCSALLYRGRASGARLERSIRLSYVTIYLLAAFTVLVFRLPAFLYTDRNSPNLGRKQYTSLKREVGQIGHRRQRR